jgi:hypothetical protein
MAAKDLFHEAVRRALEKEQWVITNDPLKVEVGGAKFEIDLVLKVFSQQNEQARK